MQSGVYSWSPPPGVADISLEELRKARLKRHDSCHVIVVPKLLTPLWRRQLWKVSDLIFQVPASTSFWGKDMFESLFFGVCFPYISHPPWCLRGSPRMFSVARELQTVFKNDNMDGRNILSELYRLVAKLDKLPGSMVWRLLHFSH